MENINKIINNNLYKESLENLKKYEEDRKFCNHTIEHFIDVARIAYILVLEENINVSKEVIYAIEGINHDLASVEMSKEILKETTFNEEEIEIILNGIENHRSESDNKLEEIIYKADKLSRQCFNCEAEKECYWSKEKKNFTIKY